MLKKSLRNPYLYIFLFGYYGIWLGWEAIKLPDRTPAGIISALPQMGYNPTNNLARFLLAVLVPPLLCLALWVLLNTNFKKKIQRWSASRYVLPLSLVTACVMLCVCLGIVQNSTNPASNPPTYGGPYDHALLDTFHEGETLGPAISYQQKDLKPYRDFVVVHGVFQDPLRSVIAFKLFGQSIGAYRSFTTLLHIATFVLYFVLLVVLFKRDLFKAAVGLVVLAFLMMPIATLPFIGGHIFGIQFPFRDMATILFLIAGVIGLRAVNNNNPKKLRAASACIGFIAVAGFANSIDRAFYIAALSLVWLALLYIIQSKKGFAKTAAWPYLLGALVGVPVLGLALKWAFTDFFSYLLTMSRYKEYLDGIAFVRPDLPVTLVLLTVSALIAIGGASILQVLRRKPLPAKGKLQAVLKLLRPLVQKHAIAILLFVTAAFFLRSAIGRAVPDHFIYSVQWLYLFLVYVGINYAYQVWRKQRLVLGFISVLLLGSCLIFYAVQIKRIDIRNDAFPLHVSDKKFMRTDHIETANYLKKHLQPDESFATLTSEGAWYYFVDKPSPLQYPIIWYAFTGAQRQVIAKQLDTKQNIKYIITNNNWTSNFDFVPNPIRFPEVYAILHQHYEPYKGFGQQTVWIRR